MSHVSNVHAISENRQCMQYNDKNEHKKHKNITCTYKDNVVQMTFYALQDLIGGRRVNTVMGISRLHTLLSPMPTISTYYY